MTISAGRQDVTDAVLHLSEAEEAIQIDVAASTVLEPKG
jgi:hypothetical protein